MKVEFNDYLKSLTNGAVISCGSNFAISKTQSILQSLQSLLSGWSICLNDNCHHRLENIISTQLEKIHDTRISYKVFDEGLECEILDTGFTEWKKGKLQAKLVLEFIPDESELNEPESPLDEIRREISQLKQES